MAVLSCARDARELTMMATKPDDMQKMERQLKRLKYSRRGKRASITKRIENVRRLVGENGSRTIIRKLLEGLLKVYEELTQVCEDISNLCDDVDEFNCLDLVRTDVETCAAFATESLEARKNLKNRQLRQFC